MHLEQILKFNFFAFRSWEWLVLVRVPLFNFIRLPPFMTLFILIFFLHSILGNLPDLIWQQKDRLSPSQPAGETNQFLLPDRVIKVLLCNAFYCYGNRRWDFPMELDLYIHREKQFFKSLIPFFCCHVYSTINAINWVPKERTPNLFMWVWNETSIVLRPSLKGRQFWKF